MRLDLVLESHGGNTAGFVIPGQVVETLGGGRQPRVVVTVGVHTWRSSIAVRGDRSMLGVSQANRAAAGVEAGQTVAVEITLDTAERTVDVPPALAVVLADDPGAAGAWAAWSFTRRKEAARGLTEARRPETRERRLAAVLGELRG